MMAVLWVIFILASTGFQLIKGFPVSPTPGVYPQENNGVSVLEKWTAEGGVYAALPVLALVIAAAGLLFGCTWCYRHKDCKPNEGAENQIFTASVTHLHEARRSQPPDSGFSEPVNNNISEDNNNGPISLREMQNIANNNAAAYIVSENEERNRISRESVVEFEPLPSGIGVVNPLEHCADWFAGEDLPRNRLQYLREIGRGWYGRVLEGELEDGDSTNTVAVKILNQNATLEDKARFLDEARLYRDMNHENVLSFITKCLQEDPWLLIFELCSMDLQQYLTVNRPKMAILNEKGVPLQLACDIASGLAYLHSRGHLYPNLSSESVLIRGEENPRAVLGQYTTNQPDRTYLAPESLLQPPIHTAGSEVWSLGALAWAAAAAAPPPHPPPLPPPAPPARYTPHLYQVMQLCWNPNPENRPTASQVHALINHLLIAHTRANDASKDDGYGSSDFEERWQRLKPNTIPKLDEHVAIVHAPSTSMTSHFTGSDQDFDNAQTIQDSLSVEMDTAVSRSSSIMSDKDPLSLPIKSDSLTNLHGSLEDVRNIYLTHNETPALECHQGNVCFEDREKEQDRSDSSMDPWIKDIIADSQDDVSYFKDVSDVIKNLDNILNSEKTSSSESSHQASPSRDNLSLECKKDFPIQTSMVKSPGISNFKNILEMGFDANSEIIEPCEDDECDRDTIGNLSHSFERHSDTTSQQTLENITPETPIKDADALMSQASGQSTSDVEQEFIENKREKDLPKHIDISLDVSKCNNVPKLKELCVAATPSISETFQNVIEDNSHETPFENKLVETRTDNSETKSVDINSMDMKCENAIPVCQISHNDLEKNSTRQSSDGPNLTNTLINPSLSLSVLPPENCSENLTSNERLENTDLSIIKRNSLTNTDINTTHDLPFENINKGDADVRSDLRNTDSFQVITSHNIADTVSTIVHDKPLDIGINANKTYVINQSNLNKLQLNNDSNELIEKEKAESILLSNAFPNGMNGYYVLNNERCFKQNESGNVTDFHNTENFMVGDTIKNKISKEITDEIDTESFDGKFSNESDEIKNRSPTNFDAVIHSSPVDKKEQENKNTESTARNISLNTSNNLIDTQTFDISDNEFVNSNSTHIDCPIVIEKQKEPPETVQNILLTPSHLEKYENNLTRLTEISLEIISEPNLKSGEVQNVSQVLLPDSLIKECDIEDSTVRVSDICRSDSSNEDLNIAVNEPSCNSIDYMDIHNGITKDIYDICVKDLTTCPKSSGAVENFSVTNYDSTVYLDLPSISRETDEFLHAEKVLSSQTMDFKDNEVLTSTPKNNENLLDSTLEARDNEALLNSIKGSVCQLGETLIKEEQKPVLDNYSPCESPTKSHQTDTYDENSSVVLGPFENCTFESLKSIKTTSEIIDLPKEELLAFSSNFSEMNLETPSPLRDGNFLNEVPDIIPDEMHLDNIQNISEVKPVIVTENITFTDTDEQLSTEKRVSPSTPPNSPGNFLASTSQQKYLIDIDINPMNTLPDMEGVLDLNQIELQMTTKLAMAENENNMNLEYCGPLDEMLRPDDEMLAQYRDDIVESYLAGNGHIEGTREIVAIDEYRMKELRNELELKLPLAQVSGISPADAGWCEPPPPELVVAYGALSPIAEETRHQLAAYHTDDLWNYSTRTESSESYPEPCNNSMDDVTDLPTGIQSGPQHSHEHSTYTLPSKEHSVNHTYTVQKEIISSKEITMSADSLNASPLKKKQDKESPIDDKTYTKNDDEKESTCERLSQVSPFLLSPTTDTSVPDSEIAGGVSTLSKTTVPTDAKLSKPSETQCLSKATSIDSWCSNDTLYNCEENFEDLAMDPDLPLDFEQEPEKDKSESENTLTHNEGDKELSHCSTYIVHDSKSEVCETFSPDSITANENYTYTKAKTDAAGITPSVITKSDVNDSTKNTQTKDLAYETLMSGVPTYSNCTTELASAMDETWKLPPPELVRRSPIPNDLNFTPPKNIEDTDKSIDNKKNDIIGSPKLTSEPSLKKMDSVELTCLKDKSEEFKIDFIEDDAPLESNESLNRHFRNMANSVTSTPFSIVTPDDDKTEAVPFNLPQENTEHLSSNPDSITSFQAFFQSAEIRPQDISSNSCGYVNSEILLEGESKTLSKNSNKDDSEKSPTYSDFEYSAVAKPQNSKEKSSQSAESGVSSEDFQQFENSAKNCPQDLSSLINASSLFLKNERLSSDDSRTQPLNIKFDLSKYEDNVESINSEFVGFISNFMNLVESHSLDNSQPINIYTSDINVEEETDQPHSIIITESPIVTSKITPNKTFDSHTKTGRNEMYETFDSHGSSFRPGRISWGSDSTKSERLNDVSEEKPYNDEKSPVKDCPQSNSPVPDTSENSQELTKQVDSAFNVHGTNSNIPQNDISSKEINPICNGGNEMYATVNFLNVTFEELVESNVDDNEVATDFSKQEQTQSESTTDIPVEGFESLKSIESTACENSNESNVESVKVNNSEDDKLTSVTEDFLQNEKKFCEFDAYFPLLSDIRFTGPGTEMMTTSFQDSPTEPTSPECEQDSKPDPSVDILKDWDSDSDSQSTNSSSGEFIWKDGDGHETAVVPTTYFEHQREGESQGSHSAAAEGEGAGRSASSGSGSGSDSGSGSEGDEVEFVPSSWDCRAAPSKSSLRSLEQPQDSKKRVVFKRQKYHCVYEYPRELPDLDTDSPAYLPDFSTYADWDAHSAEDAELGYGQLFGPPDPLDLFRLRSGIAFGADYDEDFFISSSARPFESLGVMSTSSQFFPGMHVKGALLEREFPEISDEFPPPPSPLPTLAQTTTPSLDFTTPDSGVEDITPGSMAEDDYKAKKLPEMESTQCWRSVDSTSSSESVSPSSPGGEALGGLRHTRDKLKLDLPPSPHIPSPRHNRVFNFVLDKPKRQEKPSDMENTPIVMTDETPIITSSLPMPNECDDNLPEPTFSTFGKSTQCKAQEPEKNIILTDDNNVAIEEIKEENSKKVEPVKGEGTVLDSGDEDSGIESCSKATLERNKPTPNVS